MLVANRQVVVDGERIFETPLLVPSFSSKGFPKVRTLIANLEGSIFESTLISAYDIHFKFIKTNYSFTEVVFVDSGGYEATVDHDLSDPMGIDHNPRRWTRKSYRKVIKNLKNPNNTNYIVVNYDNPDERPALAKQIKFATEDFRLLKPNIVREFLIKPNPKRKEIDMGLVKKHLPKLAPFSIIGVTEKELGDSTFRRMEQIATLRKAMSEIGLTQPIHVFGAYDPIAVPLYYFAGADIFDGLTWLRFALNKGQVIYRQNFAQVHYDVDMDDDTIKSFTWTQNLRYMASLQRQMRTFLTTRDLSVFEDNRDVFDRYLKHFEASVSGGK